MVAPARRFAPETDAQDYDTLLKIIRRRYSVRSYRPDPVPDTVWDEAARHYDERGLATLVLSIAMTNVWNRLNVATRQVAGGWG